MLLISYAGFSFSTISFALSSLSLELLTLAVMLLYSSDSVFLSLLINSSYEKTVSSAAADGVGALKSATKSAIVVSVSCPTADTTGVLHSKIALATISSLKAHKSSIEPPPLPTIITSTPNWSSALIAFTIDTAAPSP